MQEPEDEEACIMSTSAEADPAVLAAVAAHATARTAHHEAGHAVAAVHRGSRLTGVHLGSINWSDPTGDTDTPAITVHRSTLRAQPFITFAGPWAQATWEVQQHPDDDLDDVLMNAWDDNNDGDGAKYEGFLAILTDAAESLGFGDIGRRWEISWAEELTELWPAICEVAQWLLDGHTVSHDMVAAAVARAQTQTQETPKRAKLVAEALRTSESTCW